MEREGGTVQENRDPRKFKKQHQVRLDQGKSWGSVGFLEVLRGNNYSDRLVRGRAKIPRGLEGDYSDPPTLKPPTSRESLGGWTNKQMGSRGQRSGGFSDPARPDEDPDGQEARNTQGQGR